MNLIEKNSGYLASEEQLNAVIAGKVNEQIESLEVELLKQEQVDIPVEHHYANGMYTRKIVIPKGVMVTGAVHKLGYVDIMLSGDITIATPDGLIRLSGHNVMEGKPGRKRIGYAHEDTHWITVHNIAEEDSCENYLSNMTFKSMQEYKTFKAHLSYTSVLRKLNFSEEVVRAQSEITSDIIELPEEYQSNVKTGTSYIEGTGLFSNKEFNIGQLICPARLDGNRTIAGRFTNHSGVPNAVMQVQSNGDVFLIAMKKLLKDEEITTDYLHTIQIQKEQLCQV